MHKLQLTERQSERPTYTTEIEEWLAVRRLEALKIDPETAEADWCYGYVMDPYDVDPDLPEELQQVGRVYFARRPGGDVWVWFGDLPDDTHKKLREKYRRKLAFPAGLELAFPSGFDEPGAEATKG